MYYAMCFKISDSSPPKFFPSFLVILYALIKFYLHI